MKIYFISGLGADRRAFRRITLPENCEPVFLDWIEPLKKEPMRSYAQRLAEKINTNEPFALVGLSLGGMLASEMMGFLRPEKTIIICSIACKKELPWYLRWGGTLRVHKLIPARTANRPNRLLYWIFSLKEKEDRKLLDEIVIDADIKFIRWALDAITRWKKKDVPEHLIRISGGKDRLLPVNRYKPQYFIPGGGHLLVLTHAKDVSKIIAEEITR